MINYFKIAVRNLFKHKRFTLINITGLAMGLCCFILIMLWVQDELSFDRFHKNANRIYLASRTSNGTTISVTSRMLSLALLQDFPQVENATACINLPESIKIYLKNGNRGFEENLAFIDTEFFEIFSFDYIEGTPKTALVDPNSIVITKSMAEKYFGKSNPLGQTLVLSLLGKDTSMKITGILKDIPRNSQIQRSIFVPIPFITQTFGIDSWNKWGNQQSNTYILVKEHTDIAALNKEIADFEREQLPNQNLDDLYYSLMPLTKLHLYSKDIGFFEATGDIMYVYMFSAIAVLVLLIASMNYINLSNALSLKRAREIGIHKVVGAVRKNLVLQHFSETFIITAAALFLGLLLAELFLPVINNLSGKMLSPQFTDFKFLAFLLLILVLTSAVSSLYPAIFVSGFQPIQVLKGRFSSTGGGKRMQRGLIIFQFAVSIVIMTSTVIVFNQLHFFQNANLGYDKENIVSIRVKGDIYSQYDAFKNKLLANPGILAVSLSEPVELSSLGRTGGIQWPGKKGEFSTWILHTDAELADAYKFEMKEGRFFSEQYATDAKEAYVLNETAVKEMGLDSPVGSELTVWRRKGRIIGVVKDFHFSTLHDKIEPLIFRVPDPREQHLYYRAISIRFDANALPQGLDHLKDAWLSVYPNQAFDYYFIDDQLNNSYNAEMRMGELFKYFSILTILIACLGLWGLTAFSIEQKVKDIGVYKVLGAGVFKIMIILSQKFILWILLSNVIAWPIAWFLMNNWLQQYAYRISIGLWVFVAAGIATMFIAMLSISWQTIRAANADPIDALRYE